MIIMKSSYPDGTPLTLEYDIETKEWVWTVGDQVHMITEDLWLDDLDACHHASLILENLIGRRGDVLVGGVGFGHTIHTLKREDGVQVDAVEINEDVIKMYLENYGGRPEVADNVYCEDFAKYIRTSTKKYDAIFLQVDFFGCDTNHKERVLCTSGNEEIYTKDTYNIIYERLNNRGFFLFDCLCNKNDMSLVKYFNDIGYYANFEVRPYWREEVKDIQHLTIKAYKAD